MLSKFMNIQCSFKSDDQIKSEGNIFKIHYLSRHEKRSILTEISFLLTQLTAEQTQMVARL